jgi:ATP-binding protein involved in chromosome partitioning
MAYFTPAELPNNKYYIFGREGGKKLAVEANVPLLGEIPLVQGICESGDSGTPVTLLDVENPESKAFKTLAENIIRRVNYIHET